MTSQNNTNTSIDKMRKSLNSINRLQEKDKKNNKILLNIINNVKNDIEYIHRLIKVLGFEDVSDLYSLEKIYKDNKNKYIEKGNIYDLFNTIINIQNETNDINKKQIIENPIKVSLNNAFYNKYFKLLLDKKDEKYKSSNEFVLYRFKNVVNKVIFRNKKKIFHEKVNKSIIHMKSYISSMLPPKVNLNDALYMKFKKERIKNNTNKLKLTFNKIIINNRIRKLLIKYKKQKNKEINVLNKNKK